MRDPGALTRRYGLIEGSFGEPSLSPMTEPAAGPQTARREAPKALLSSRLPMDPQAFDAIAALPGRRLRY